MNCARSYFNSCCNRAIIRGAGDGAARSAAPAGSAQPHLGGQWQAGSPTLRIPYYRTLEALDPLTLTGRAEQHLVSTLHAGLTRLMTGNPEPQPDLAHHWQISDRGLRWRFFLRSQLRWHNGEPLTGHQLLQTLENCSAIRAANPAWPTSRASACRIRCAFSSIYTCRTTGWPTVWRSCLA